MSCRVCSTVALPGLGSSRLLTFGKLLRQVDQVQIIFWYSHEGSLLVCVVTRHLGWVTIFTISAISIKYPLTVSRSTTRSDHRQTMFCSGRRAIIHLKPRQIGVHNTMRRRVKLDRTLLTQHHSNISNRHGENSYWTTLYIFQTNSH